MPCRSVRVCPVTGSHFIPHRWLQVLLWMMGQYNMDLGGLSTFDGEQFQMSKALNEMHIMAASIEILNNPVWQDILSDKGLQMWMQYTVRTKEYGLHWYAPPCSMWTRFVSAHTHKRKEDIHGDPNNPHVERANKIAEFVAMAIMVCWSFGICYVIENPLNSYIFEFPIMSFALQFTGATRVVV